LILDSADSIIETIDKKKAVCKEGQRRPCSTSIGSDHIMNNIKKHSQTASRLNVSIINMKRQKADIVEPFFSGIKSSL
jgi:hypothetical protein